MRNYAEKSKERVFLWWITDLHRITVREKNAIFFAPTPHFPADFCAQPLQQILPALFLRRYNRIAAENSAVLRDTMWCLPLFLCNADAEKRNPPESSGILRNPLEYSGIFRNPLESSGILWNTPESSGRAIAEDTAVGTIAVITAGLNGKNPRFVESGD